MSTSAARFLLLATFVVALLACGKAQTPEAPTVAKTAFARGEQTAADPCHATAPIYVSISPTILNETQRPTKELELVLWPVIRSELEHAKGIVVTQDSHVDGRCEISLALKVGPILRTSNLVVSFSLEVLSLTERLGTVDKKLTKEGGGTPADETSILAMAAEIATRDMANNVHAFTDPARASEKGSAFVESDEASGCKAKKCSGNVGQELVKGLSYRAKEAYRCYDNALATTPTLKGRVAIEVRVATDGSSCSAKVKSSEDGMDPVAACAAHYFRVGAFAAPEGGCVDVVIPINFVPRP